MSVSMKPKSKIMNKNQANLLQIGLKQGKFTSVKMTIVPAYCIASLQQPDIDAMI